MKCAITIISLVVLTSFSAYSQGPTKQTVNVLALDQAVAKHKGLDDIYSRFADGYKTLDSALVANLYTESAAYLPPGGDVMIGRQNITKTFADFFDSVKQRKGRLQISFRIVQRQVDKDLAYDVGIYTLTSFNEKGEASSGRGKFVVVAKRDEDRIWRFQVDGYSDMPK
jgi:uncharacterized protein (TIGR02246 family)